MGPVRPTGTLFSFAAKSRGEAGYHLQELALAGGSGGNVAPPASPSRRLLTEMNPGKRWAVFSATEEEMPDERAWRCCWRGCLTAGAELCSRGEVGGGRLGIVRA